jgi:hypothetical protein
MDSTRSCLCSIIDRFNTEDPFWSAFVPDTEATVIEPGRFSLTLRGKGIRLDVCGVLIREVDNPSRLTPSLVVGAKRPSDASRPEAWHPITCSVDRKGRFATSNFRIAIEASIDDVRMPARAY